MDLILQMNMINTPYLMIRSFWAAEEVLGKNDIRYVFLNNICSEILTTVNCLCRVEPKSVDASSDAGVEEDETAVGCNCRTLSRSFCGWRAFPVFLEREHDTYGTALH